MQPLAVPPPPVRASPETHAVVAPSPSAIAPMDDPLANAKSFAYQLTALVPERLAASPFDVLVIDYSRDGSEERRLTATEIEALQRRPGLPRRVLAYLSIGEAETYRYYWQPSWDSARGGDGAAPSWLGPANPRWRNNHKVRYWDPDWQAIVFAYLDKILDAGFDGVYLDIVDAYEFWGEGGESGEGGHRATAAREMVEFVKAIAVRARLRHPGFAVVPQNGEGLSRYPDYVATTSAIAKEDLYYDGEKRQSATETDEALANLKVFHAAGKPVFVVDYVSRPAFVKELYRRARAAGFIPYATVRNLDTLTLHPGFDP